MEFFQSLSIVWRRLLSHKGDKSSSSVLVQGLNHFGVGWNCLGTSGVQWEYWDAEQHPGISHFWGMSWNYVGNIHKRGAEILVTSHRLRCSRGEFTNILKICKPSHPNSNLCPRNTEDVESESRTPRCSVLCQSK